MSLGVIAFILLVFGTFVSNGVQAYIHFEAYPLIPLVGKSEFAAYLKEYESRLTVPLILPYVVTLLANLILIFSRPANLSLILVIVAFVLNLAVSIVTVMLATPIYNRIKQNGQASPDDMGQLLRINLLRLVLSTVSSLVVIAMLFALLPAA
jgi:hypothetical protein